MKIIDYLLNLSKIRLTATLVPCCDPARKKSCQSCLASASSAPKIALALPSGDIKDFLVLQKKSRYH